MLLTRRNQVGRIRVELAMLVGRSAMVGHETLTPMAPLMQNTIEMLAFVTGTTGTASLGIVLGENGTNGLAQ